MTDTERHARRTQEVTVTGELGALLLAWRDEAGVGDPIELDVDRVRAVEGTIGTRLPAPWLAVMATRIPDLLDGLSIGLGSVAEHSARARTTRVRGDFVACAAEPDGSRFYGFLKKTGEEKLAVYRPGQPVRGMGYAEWVRDQAAGEGVSLGSSATGDSLVVTLVLQVLPRGPGTRVKHKTWGVGRVLAEDGEGPTRKVKAEFPGLGLKVVQARFLEFLED